MIYPDNFEKKIGFSEIRDLLKSHCQSQLGRERVDSIQMMTDSDKISQAQNQTRELGQILETLTEVPEMSFYDMRETIQRIRI